MLPKYLDRDGVISFCSHRSVGAVCSKCFAWLQFPAHDNMQKLLAVPEVTGSETTKKIQNVIDKDQSGSPEGSRGAQKGGRNGRSKAQERPESSRNGSRRAHANSGCPSRECCRAFCGLWALWALGERHPEGGGEGDLPRIGGFWDAPKCQI